MAERHLITILRTIFVRAEHWLSYESEATIGGASLTRVRALGYGCMRGSTAQAAR